MLAAAILVGAVLIGSLTFVGLVRNWADGRKLGGKPWTVAIAIATAVLVQLPLPDGPDWRNVPLAVAILIGNLG